MGQSSSTTQTRLLTPDVARGLTLLGIAIANSATAWMTFRGAPAATHGGIVNDSVLDKLAIVFNAIFVNVRGVSMFSFMLGYGVGMLALACARRGYPWPKTRNVLLKRYALLALFGLVHMVLLFYGDIMLFYGLAACLLVLLLRARLSTVLVLAGFCMVLLWPLVGMLLAVDSFAEDSQAVLGAHISGYLDQVIEGVHMVLLLPLSFPVTLMLMFPVMALGMVAGQLGVLSNPQQYRRWLYLAIAVTVVVSLVCGLLLGLSLIGVTIRMDASIASGFNDLLGVVTGPGIVAAIALVVQRWEGAESRGQKVPVFVQACAALGRRSMSGYVGQSLLFALLVTPYGFGLLRYRGAFEASFMGLVVWLITLGVAYAMEVEHMPGPLEKLHRRLAYGKSGL